MADFVSNHPMFVCFLSYLAELRCIELDMLKVGFAGFRGTLEGPHAPAGYVPAVGDRSATSTPEQQK